VEGEKRGADRAKKFISKTERKKIIAIRKERKDF
jgi:hypothetical protein